MLSVSAKNDPFQSFLFPSCLLPLSYHNCAWDAMLLHWSLSPVYSFFSLFAGDKLPKRACPACPACPVAPGDGTGVGMKYRTGAKFLSSL